MSTDEFKAYIKSDAKFSRIGNYIISCLFLLGGIYVAFKIIQDGRNLKENEIWLLPLILIFFGAYGLWRTGIDFRIASIYSNHRIDEKHKIIAEYESTLNVIDKKVESNFIEFTYRNYFGNQVVVRTLLDEEKILYNLQSVSVGGLGFADFGLMHRATNKLKRYLKGRL